MSMKKNYLLFTALSMSLTLWADPAIKDVTGLFQLDTSFSVGLDVSLSGKNAENGLKGCVADFNHDGVDDFVLTGIYQTGSPAETKAFLQVYLGQKDEAPFLAYQNDDFEIAGSGAVDCAALEDGSFLLAVQGGAAMTWPDQPFRGMVYRVTADAATAACEPLCELAHGGGKGSLLFLDVNGDGRPDLFQSGWKGAASDKWGEQANIYINQDNRTFMLSSVSAGIQPSANAYPVKGDVNGDGRVDVVIPRRNSALYAYINRGDGTFVEKVITPFQGRPDGVNVNGEEDSAMAEVVDVDEDGRGEVILTCVRPTGTKWSFNLYIYHLDEQGIFVEMPAKNKAGDPAIFSGGNRADFAVADFNNDGFPDFIFGAENQNDAGAWACRTYLMSGNGEGGFDQSDITYDAVKAPESVVPMTRKACFGRFLTGDFNGDSKPDLLTAGATFYGKTNYMRLHKNIAPKDIVNLDKSVNNDLRVYTADGGIIVQTEDSAAVAVYTASGMRVCETRCIGRITCPVITPGLYLVTITRPGDSRTCKVMVR